MGFLRWLKKHFCCCCSCRRRKKRDKPQEDAFGPGTRGGCGEDREMERRTQRTALQVEDFKFLAVLGQGGFGKVFLAEYQPRRTLLAVKTLRKSAIWDIGSLKTEKRVLEGNTQRKHPCLINLFGCFQTPTHVALAVEYAPGGDLWHYRRDGEPLQEPFIRFCGGCVTLGLEFLHSARIIYRDLKLDNLVIDPEGYVKITDFGLCKEGMGYRDRARTRCGTPETLAPEVVDHKPYTRAVDWWSFGVVLYQLSTGKDPFAGDGLRLLANILRATVKYPAGLSADAISIMSQLLMKKPKKRLGGGKRGAKDIKRHVFFKDFAWEELLQRQMTSPFGPVERQHQRDPSSVSDISLLSTSAAGPTELHFEGFSCIVEGALSTHPSRESSSQWQRTSASTCCEEEEEEEMWEEGPTSPLSQPPSLAPSSTGCFPPAAPPPPSRLPSPALSIETAPSLLDPSALSCSLRMDSERSTDCAGARAASLPDNFGHQQDAPSRLPSCFLRSQTT